MLSGNIYDDGNNMYDDDEEGYGQYDQPELGSKVPPPPPASAQGNIQSSHEPANMKVQAPVSVQAEPGLFAKVPIPLSMITSGTAVWLIAGSILHIVLEGPDLADFIIDCYFVFFGLCLLLIMMPTAFGFMKFLESSRSGVEKWARFIATNWGQGYFMIFMCILAFGNKSFFRITIGIVLVLTGILSIWCGRLAAKKYNRLRDYLAAGNEGDAMVKSIENLARAVLVDSLITEMGVKSLVERSGRSVTPSEVHAIFCFFDRDRNGKVELKLFTETILENERLKSL